MNQYSDKLSAFITKNSIDARVLVFETSCHSVEEAAASANASVDQFVKNICTVDLNGHLVVSIIRGKDKLDLKKVSALVGSKLRFATPEEILEKTGYPAGGTPSFGYSAKFFIDKKVLEMPLVYSGGGSTTALTQVKPSEICRLNNPTIDYITK